MTRFSRGRAFILRIADAASIASALAFGLIVGGLSTASHAQRMLLPVGPGRISSGFFDPQYPRTEHRQHLGADFLAPTGSPVYAPVEGDIVVNNTAASDVMDAYLVIRSGGGVEHVLGHIASGLSARSHVKAGQQVGTIRPWPGQPNRSHVHWGVNRFGVLQAMRGGWGWGRAPEQATRAEAEARGWTAP